MVQLAPVFFGLSAAIFTTGRGTTLIAEILAGLLKPGHRFADIPDAFDFGVLSLLENSRNCYLPQPWNPHQFVFARLVDVDWKVFRMKLRPVFFGINVERKVAR